MPTYSYRCTQCDHAFDIHQAFTDDTLTICPNCGGTLRKIFSPVGVTFSGSGFYRNDSRAAARADSAKADGAKADGAKSDAPKAESSKADSSKKANAPAKKESSTQSTSSSSGGGKS